MAQSNTEKVTPDKQTKVETKTQPEQVPSNIQQVLPVVDVDTKTQTSQKSVQSVGISKPTKPKQAKQPKKKQEVVITPKF